MLVCLSEGTCISVNGMQRRVQEKELQSWPHGGRDEVGAETHPLFSVC